MSSDGDSYRYRQNPRPPSDLNCRLYFPIGRGLELYISFETIDDASSLVKSDTKICLIRTKYDPPYILIESIGQWNQRPNSPVVARSHLLSKNTAMLTFSSN